MHHCSCLKCISKLHYKILCPPASAIVPEERREEPNSTCLQAMPITATVVLSALGDGTPEVTMSGRACRQQKGNLEMETRMEKSAEALEAGRLLSSFGTGQQIE